MWKFNASAEGSLTLYIQPPVHPSQPSHRAGWSGKLRLKEAEMEEYQSRRQMQDSPFSLHVPFLQECSDLERRKSTPTESDCG